jgi:hypothetical protein
MTKGLTFLQKGYCPMLFMKIFNFSRIFSFGAEFSFLFTPIPIYLFLARSLARIARLAALIEHRRTVVRRASSEVA